MGGARKGTLQSLSLTTPPEPPEIPGRTAAALKRLLSLEDRFLRAPASEGPAGRSLRALQLLVLSCRRYRKDHAGDRAAALAYTTLLSMLPILFLALAVFGALVPSSERLEGVRDALFRNFVPETARGLQSTFETTLASLQDVSEELGLLGFILLVLTASKLLATLDRTFQQIWGKEEAASKLRRFLGFWITVLLSPFLVTASVFASGAAQALSGSGLQPVRTVADNVAFLVPLIPGWLGLLVAYRLWTGARVSLRAAVAGATVAALLWETLKLGFTAYIRHAFFAKTVLSGMGVLPLFLVWLYLSWAVFVLGAEIVYVAEDYERALRRCGSGSPTPGAVPADPPPGP